MAKQPAFANELRTTVSHYARLAEPDCNGVECPVWRLCGKPFKVKIRQQFSMEKEIAHQQTDVFKATLILRWNQAKNVGWEDILVAECGDHWSVIGRPLNWEGKNQWGVVTVVSIKNCNLGATCTCQSQTQL